MPVDLAALGLWVADWMAAGPAVPDLAFGFDPALPKAKLSANMRWCR
jgi:hypothetical protein